VTLPDRLLATLTYTSFLVVKAMCKTREEVSGA
jgi:hypothetical protein